MHVRLEFFKLFFISAATIIIVCSTSNKLCENLARRAPNGITFLFLLSLCGYSYLGLNIYKRLTWIPHTRLKKTVTECYYNSSTPDPDLFSITIYHHTHSFNINIDTNLNLKTGAVGFH